MRNIRQANEEDWPRLKVLIGWACKELFDEYCQSRLDLDIERIVSSCLLNKLGVWVLEDEHAMVQGYICWTGHANGEVVIGAGTYLIPSLRGHKYSDDLRNVASVFWKDKGFRKVQGVVAQGNIAGWESAERNGFKVVGYALEKVL